MKHEVSWDNYSLFLASQIPVEEVKGHIESLVSKCNQANFTDVKKNWAVYCIMLKMF